MLARACLQATWRHLWNNVRIVVLLVVEVTFGHGHCSRESNTGLHTQIHSTAQSCLENAAHGKRGDTFIIMLSALLLDFS
jgi:hypothetical protein